MGDKTGIEWTDATWNPVTGCTKVSPGCDHCYAETFAERWRGTPGHYFESGFDVQTRPAKLDLPLRWKRPRRIFVNSMSDLFHRDVPDEYIAAVFAVMSAAPQHTFQLLTKRHARMQSLLSSPEWPVLLNAQPWWDDDLDPERPLPNVWLGVSVENQHWANIRVPALLNTPAAVRFLSCEPLLGPVNLTAINDTYPNALWDYGSSGTTKVDWVIVGGESGRGARPMHPDWVRAIRDQCHAASVPFLFKQRGEWTWNEPGRFVMPRQPYTDNVAVMHGAGMTAMTKSNPFNPFEQGHPFWTTRIERLGKHKSGRLLDGRTWDEYPSLGDTPEQQQ